MSAAFTLRMNKKNLILIGLVFAAAAAYVVFFTNWFQPRIIQVAHTSRSFGRGGSNPLTFSLGEFYELTEVKVVSLAELQTNPLAPPLWHLVSDEGSESVNHFSYGENIPAMDPVIQGARPESLKPGVAYRLFVTAGKARGQHDFYIGAPPPNAITNK
jgi:hypothetical protein